MKINESENRRDYMEKINTVYRTKNYKRFKRLDGNRDITRQRVNGIIDSIKKVGYIQSPIIVNEKMEIIDGQGRVDALERLGLPIDYIIVKGIGINECRAMNIKQTNWTTNDFIKSYAEGGNVSYKYFNCLIKQYARLGTTAIFNALTGLCALDHNMIKSGVFSCTEEQYEKASKILSYENKFVSVVKKIRGRADYIYIAIGYCYSHKDVDNERLYEKISEKYERFISPANIEQALDEISKIYNERLRGPKLYLSTDYKREMEEKYSWYKNKWGKSRARHYQ